MRKSVSDHTDHHVVEKHRMTRSFLDRRDNTIHPRLFDIPNLKLDPSAAAVFLHMGYVPGSRTLFEDVACLPGGAEYHKETSGTWQQTRRFQFPAQPELRGLPAEDWHQTASTLLMRAAEDALAGTHEIVIPLSGGLDSRALLGLALELLPAKSIRTLSYGVSGTLDFDLGNRVAQLAGTRHIRLELPAQVPTVDQLIQTALDSDANTNLLPPVVWQRIRSAAGTDVPYWTGYTGDGVGGSFFMPAREATEESSARRLIGLENRFYHWSQGSSQVLADASSMALRRTKYEQVLSQDEGIWFENHPERYTAHHIFLDGVRYQAPFMDDAFAGFFLALPDQARRNKVFFNEFVARRFPKLFSIPTRSYGPALAYHSTLPKLRNLAWRGEQLMKKALYRVAPKRFVHPHLTYVDYNVAIREDADFRHTMRELCFLLAEEQVVDAAQVERLFQRHLAGEPLADTIMLLASLEVAQLASRSGLRHKTDSNRRVALSSPPLRQALSARKES